MYDNMFETFLIKFNLNFLMKSHVWNSLEYFNF